MKEDDWLWALGPSNEAAYRYTHGIGSGKSLGPSERDLDYEKWILDRDNSKLTWDQLEYKRFLLKRAKE